MKSYLENLSVNVAKLLDRPFFENWTLNFYEAHFSSGSKACDDASEKSDEENNSRELLYPHLLILVVDLLGVSQNS